jgi:hypothetical protein
MSDRCEFEVTDWRTTRTVSEKGASPKDPPKWPAVGALRTGACLGCEREGPRTEKYTVKFADTKAKGGDPVTCDVAEAKWAKFEKGTKWKGKVRIVTGGVDCDALARQ